MGTQTLSDFSLMLAVLAALLPVPGKGHMQSHTYKEFTHIYFSAVQTFEPGFISPLENTTVAAGRPAHFTCVVKHLGGHKVEKNNN